MKNEEVPPLFSLLIIFMTIEFLFPPGFGEMIFSPPPLISILGGKERELESLFTYFFSLDVFEVFAAKECKI
jgi:hypothetical protein